MENLLNLFKEALPNNFGTLASQYLGEPEEQTNLALTALLPTVLGALFRKGSTPDGAADLLHLFKTENIDSGILNNIAGIFSGSGNAANKLVQQGSALASRLFGGQEEALSEALASTSNIKPSAAMDLLALVIPAILGFLKKYLFDKYQDPNSLAALFAGQGQYLEGRLDKGLLKALGFTSPTAFLSGLMQPKLETTTKTKAEPVAKTVEPAAWPAQPISQPMEPVAQPAEPTEEPAYASEMQRRRKARFLPWLAALLALFAILYFWQVFTGPDHWQRGEGVLPGAYCLPANVYFNVGQADIDPASQETIAKTAQCIKKDNVKVAISGYTDRTGDIRKNMELAKDRAKVVRDALVAAGVPGSDIVLANPREWNGTTAGTGSNREARRVEITKSKK